MEVPLPPTVLTSVMWGEGEGKHHLAGGAQGGGRSGEYVSGEGRKEERGGGREDSGRVSGTCQNWQGKGAQYTGRLWALFFSTTRYFLFCCM